MSEEATEKQKSYLKALMKERDFDGMGGVLSHLIDSFNKTASEQLPLTRNQASILIQYLQDLKKPDSDSAGQEADSDIPW